MTYLGNTPTTQSFISGTDYFNGTGSQTAFTLSRTVASVNDVEAVVNNVVQRPNDAYTISGTTITFTSAPSAGTSNIYVRYLSTTTQSITPAQNTVSYSTMNTDMQNLFGQSFTNRIINGAMMIDQRNAGASVTPIDGQFSVDRWKAGLTQASKYTVQQNAGSVTPPTGFKNYLGITSSSSYSVLTGDTFLFEQAIEGFNVSDLGWGTANAATITLSFWVRSSLTGTFGGAINNSASNRSYPFSYTISSANTWEQKSITVAGDTSGTWLTNNGVGIKLRFGLGSGSTFSGTAGAWAAGNLVQPTGTVSVVSTNGATFFITGVQLEKGSTATSFDYRPYGTELALCQRYYYKWLNDSGISSYVTNLQAFSTGGAFGKVLDFPVTMRATPTCGTSGTFLANNPSGTLANAFTTTVIDQPTRNSIATGGWQGSSSLVAGNSSVITITNNAFIQASAEL